MSEVRRVSADELEARYKTKHGLLDFFDLMKTKIHEHFEDKGISWKTCPIGFLKLELLKHAKNEDWVDVANFAFMLDDRQRNKK